MRVRLYSASHLCSDLLVEDWRVFVDDKLTYFLAYELSDELLEELEDELVDERATFAELFAAHVIDFG